MNFVPLHLHSSHSPQWGVKPVEELCAAARALGATRLALTDRNGLYGIPRFLEAARAHGLQPIIGAEAIAGEDRALLLARNAEGYANLCRILSALHEEKSPSLSLLLQTRRPGLIVISDRPDVLLPLQRQRPEDLFVELSPGHGMEKALALARRSGIPPVATTRAVGLSAEDLLLHRVLRAVALNTKLSRLSESDVARDTDLLIAPERLKDAFPHCREALENTAMIASRCRSDWDFSRTVFPAFGNMEDKEAFLLLERRAREGALKRYGRIDTAIEERLRKELDLIRDKGFASYFLVVEELAHQCPRTCGRGSAAASLVAYALEITHVDPLRHNLFFERFLNPGRLDPPDIDVDFPWDERDRVLDFAFARYGRERAAMVANQIGFRGRSALREVAKVFGFPDEEIGRVTRRISGYWNSGQAAGAAQDAHHPLFRGEDWSEDWRKVFAVASRLGGQLRHLSLHCGGLVIVPDEIRRHVPVETSAGGRPVIQWEKDQAEAAGLVKIDLLGNRSLAVIRDALAAVEENTGLRIDYAAWRPLEDERTRALLMRGETMGCFYIESPSTRQLLRKMWGEDPSPEVRQRDLFEHLVMASSIIRPAANTFIREFVTRMRGKCWRPLHPLLSGVLDETYGIAVYQEQITQIAMALADFTAFEGDQLRKIISKKDKEKRLEDFRLKFLRGGLRKGVSREVLEEVWGQILSFAGYSFCKPHSASYALVSCKTAWLKANYPAEFMAAVLSNGGGYYSSFAYLSESRRLGLEVLSPDINESENPYRGKARDVRVGLMQVQGLTRKSREELLRERREKGPFRSFRDFLRRTALDFEDIRRLIRSGCFDALEGKKRRPALLWELLERPASGRQPELFSEAPLLTVAPPAPDFDAAAVLRQELQSLGFLVSFHPLALYQGAIAALRPVPATEMRRWVGRHITMVGWCITGKVVQTREREPMEFVTFEDATDMFETVFFPRAYARFCQLLSRHRPYVLKGKVEEELGSLSLRVEWVDLLETVGGERRLPQRAGRE